MELTDVPTRQLDAYDDTRVRERQARDAVRRDIDPSRDAGEVIDEKRQRRRARDLVRLSAFLTYNPSETEAYIRKELFHHRDRHGRRPVRRRQHQPVVGARGLGLMQIQQRLPHAGRATADDQGELGEVMRVERAADGRHELDALGVEQVWCFAVAALQDEAGHARGGHAEGVLLGGGEVERFVGVEEGYEGRVDAVGRWGGHVVGVRGDGDGMGRFKVGVGVQGRSGMRM